MTTALPDPNNQPLPEIVEFADNPEPRCPCIVLVDSSGSMNGRKIDSVNHGIKELKQTLLQDELTASRAEIAIVQFNDNAKTVQDFATPRDMNPATIQAGGSTNISGAIHSAITMLEERKRTYRTNGIECYRPIVILITDGEPTSDNPQLLQDISTHIAAQEEGRHLTFFTFAVEGADLKKLSTIAPPNRPPLPLSEAKIEDIFQWLSNSLSAVSHSQPGQRFNLPSMDFLDYG